MTTQTCRTIIGIVSRHIPPLKAQYFFEKYCDEKGLSINDFFITDVPNFILYLAEKRDSLSTLDDAQFGQILRALISLSNTKETEEINAT